MSRAFVKEQDNVALEAPPELSLGDGPNLVTQYGFERIVEKVAELETQLAGAADEATRNRLARDLRYWSARKSTAEIVARPSCDCVAFGCRVVIARNGRRQTLELVGEDEADPAHARINWRSPLAAAILGAKVGETVVWEDRQPPEEIQILAIERP
ncbi:MAG TPA: GreA/GreB family elongation factor [Rhizomicrobium sp.]